MSNDLISRKALLEALSKTEKECEEVMCIPSWAAALRAIRSQPTAYDIEEIVKRMEGLPRKKHIVMRESKEVLEYFETVRVDEYIRLDKAIEIVKGECNE